MELEHYSLEVNNRTLEYTFFSEGPRGLIKKMIRFTLVKALKVEYYNLSFGDWNEGLNDLDDSARSDNQDVKKILATIANAVIDFWKNHPNTIIYAQGSSSARTRRYQMEINKYLKELEVDIKLFGLVEDVGFVPFKGGFNYLAFLAFKKIK